ncbi:MAG: class III signal peptide-containing protein [Candidatus Diapherotrites archaeon]
MDEKGQGALEYLLLIGGAVLVAVVVIVLILGLGHSTGNEVNELVTHGIGNMKTHAGTT